MQQFVIIVIFYIILAQVRPFRMTFISDADEVTSAKASKSATKTEVMGIPSGTVGYHLNWLQQSCWISLKINFLTM